MTTDTNAADAELPAAAGLVLAAGGGRRLGGHPKALLEHRGRTLAERALAELAEAGCDPLHVVLGAGAREVHARLDCAPCTLVDNPRWADGMGSSLRAGLASLAGTSATAVVVLLVDQPRVGAPAVARVLAAHRAGASLVAAAYGGERGHPVLLARRHWAGAARAATGDRGARAYLRAHADELTLVECADVAAPDDIDTPADLGLLGLPGPTGPPSPAGNPSRPIDVP
ncbi:nucleotidyltransferase family protein [Streptomyces sp. AV19]|uniref:nucleotidyltransferase family protein n=1 Tax=Streptomyces sp. AV19 TaxID=2793068 RepID=UPI002413481D|nr:nucleotidyltransferase family protein [Streptomyces sp. AV19]MDG4535001.1 nucleotidyltransferase family protein [Streptomyces sp. AV19]